MLFFKKKRSGLKLKGKILNIEIKKRFKKNPFTLKRKRSFFSNLKNLITINITKKTLINIIIFSIILLFLGIIFILFGPNFKIKNIEILNSDGLVNIDISYDSLKDFRGKNILLLDKNELSDNLIESQKNIKSVSIGMILPDKLKIVLKSNKAIFNSKINGTNYLITQNGIAVPSNKQDPKLKNIEIKITNNFTDKIISYQKVIDEDYIKSISNIYNKIEDNILGIKIDEIKFYSVEKDVIIKINNGALLIFSLEGDIDSQIEKLVQFNTENKDGINIKNDGISYIDLRIPEKVFLCKKETENNCKANLVNIYGN